MAEVRLIAAESVLCHSLKEMLLSSSWSLFQQSPRLRGRTAASKSPQRSGCGFHQTQTWHPEQLVCRTRRG